MNSDDNRYIASASSAELDHVISTLELPFAVWTPAGEISIVNQAMAALLGESAESLIGRNVAEIADQFRPDDRRPLDILGSGGVDAIRSRREIHRHGHQPVPVWVWTRAVQVDGAFAGLALVVPIVDLRSGKDTAQRWQELDEVAVGVCTRDWRVVAVSADIAGLIGFEPGDIIGSSLLELVHRDDRRPPDGEPAFEDIACRVRLRHKAGGWTSVSVLWADDARLANRRVFAAVGMPGRERPADDERIAELETRLRRIGAEVEAAGLLDRMSSLPDVANVPQMGELTTRQWDILNRLLGGESTQTIARELYISPSTVRNHLTAIFRKFGIHSQVELLQRLR